MLAINGMSNYKRDTNNANSAIVVTVSPKDFGASPLDGINFQRDLEKRAYLLGKGKIPFQLFKDFKKSLPEATVYVYDKTLSKNKLSVGDTADIERYDDNGGKVFMRIYKDEVKEIVVIK